MKRKSSVGSLRPRNIYVVAMRARKQGVHQKTNKALRVSARIAFRKVVPSDHPGAAYCDLSMIGRASVMSV